MPLFLKIIVFFELILFSSIFNFRLEAAVEEENLRRHIQVLSADIGERNFLQHQNLEKAADYIKKELSNYGYEIFEQVYFMENKPYRNIIVTKEGKDKKDEVIIVCAHYDSVWGSPGVDDNASAVTGLLELARLIFKDNLNKSIKFIAFTNEEPPFFMSQDMGSFRYAKEAKKNKENIQVVLCLESIGFYSDKKGTQSYPLGLQLFYPDKGNFIAFVSNLGSKGLLKRMVKEFKKVSNFPIEYAALPVFLAPAISFSDNWSFWQFGYKAVMITDTAFYRNPYYHTQLDTQEKINYQSLSLVIEGLYQVLLNLGT